MSAPERRRAWAPSAQPDAEYAVYRDNGNGTFADVTVGPDPLAGQEALLLRHSDMETIALKESAIKDGETVTIAGDGRGTH